MMSDRELVYYALIKWRNYIQTGDPYISSRSALDMGAGRMCKMLTSEEQEFVVRLEEFSSEVLNGKISRL